MVKAKLNPRVLEILKKKTKLSEQVIRNALSKIRRKYPVTLNAAAHIFAQQRKFTVARYLSEEDRASLRNIEIQRIPIKIRTKTKKRIVEIAKYETTNKFLRVHLDEINRTYTFGCYTACFVIMRKVLENLIVEILRKKYSENKKEHREKYFDFDRQRNHDFNILLKNLRDSSKDFGSEKKLVERICQLADEFKETANEITHSLYHIATKKEIDEKNFQYILDLIKELENKM
jgi:hypothetical protein